MVGDRLNEYELLYIVSPRVPADDVANVIERVDALIQTAGGEILTTDNWGRRRLAYPIRQYFEGTYVLTTIKMPPAGAVGVEAALVISEEIIRHMLISGIIPRTSGGRTRDDRDRAFDAPRDDAAPREEREESSMRDSDMSDEESSSDEEPVREPEPVVAE